MVVAEMLDMDEQSPDFQQFVKNLKLDETKDADLLWVAKEAYVAPVPPNWSEFADDEGRIYFYHHVREESTWAHPFDSLYRDVISVVKEYRSASRGEIVKAIEAHLSAVHEKALKAVEGFSGPYLADDDNEYYYNDLTNVSTWDNPCKEYEVDLEKRHHLLYSCLLPEGDKPALSLNLAMVPKPAEKAMLSPDTVRFETARSQPSARCLTAGVKPPRPDDDGEFEFTFGAGRELPKIC